MSIVPDRRDDPVLHHRGQCIGRRLRPVRRCAPERAVLTAMLSGGGVADRPALGRLPRRSRASVTRGRKALAPCARGRLPAYGLSGSGLCSRASLHRWTRAGNPDPPPRAAADRSLVDWQPASQVRAAVLHAVGREPPGNLFCKNHDDPVGPTCRPSRPGRGSSPTANWSAPPTSNCAALPPQLKTGIPVRTAVPPRRPSPHHAAAHGDAGRCGIAKDAGSHLAVGADREHEWRAHGQPRVRANQSLFLLEARDAVETLRDGTGWEAEYPRDVWRLHKLPGMTPRPADPVPVPSYGSTASPSPGCVSSASGGSVCD